MTDDDAEVAELTVRRANGTDLDAIREIAKAAWQDTYEAFDEAEVAAIVDDWYDPADLEERFAAPDELFLVAEIADGLVGFCHGYVGQEEADVLRIYVHPDHQRAGVGQSLHDAFADHCREEGVSDLYAFVLADNDVGCGFYEALDFREVDTETTEILGEEYEETVYEQALWPPAEK
ncbi:N-acetyltransferase family protein [Haloparvum sp. PAK95]|uniref:GNAT family N-acetyltransferase n=1 Tax=Haloparvum sp. PAK95 TaxID=3418962 RepID=UPI003D2EF779